MELIDGQQRITTFLIIYAVLQLKLHKLYLPALEPPVGLEPTLSLKIRSAAETISQRFSYKDPVSSQKWVLLGRASLRGSFMDTKLGRLFTFQEPDRVLHDLLRHAKNARNQTREHSNAICINRWFDEMLASQELTNDNDRARWLLEFLETMDERVHWTTTLTTNRQLALDTFLNYNRETMRVPLTSADIIKVIFVGNIGGVGNKTNPECSFETQKRLKNCMAVFTTHFPVSSKDGSLVVKSFWNALKTARGCSARWPTT